MGAVIQSRDKGRLSRFKPLSDGSLWVVAALIDFGVMDKGPIQNSAGGRTLCLKNGSMVAMSPFWQMIEERPTFCAYVVARDKMLRKIDSATSSSPGYNLGSIEQDWAIFKASVVSGNLCDSQRKNLKNCEISLRQRFLAGAEPVADHSG